MEVAACPPTPFQEPHGMESFAWPDKSLGWQDFPFSSEEVYYMQAIPCNGDIDYSESKSSSHLLNFPLI